MENEIEPLPEVDLGDGRIVISYEGTFYRVRYPNGEIQAFPARTEATPEAALDDIVNDPAPLPPAPVPPSVTRRQLLLVLNAQGITRAAIRAQIGDDEAALIEYDEATTFDRPHPLVASLAAAMGLTSAQVDDLFRTAATL